MDLEQAIQKEGREIFAAHEALSEKGSIFNKDYWFALVMDNITKDPGFKTDLFRFVDVLPSLATDDQIASHVQEYLVKKGRELPLFMTSALKAASFSFAKGIAASAIKKNILDIAKKFIAGSDIDHAQNTLRSLEKQGFLFTIDLLGEKTLSDAEADSYAARYEYLIRSLPQILVTSATPNISMKISALSSALRPEDPQGSVAGLMKRVLPLLLLAKKHQVFVNFDVESFDSHEIVYELLAEILHHDQLKDWPHLGIVAQAYLQDAPKHMRGLINLVKKRKIPITVRLVKGAYWDYEVVKAQQFGHNSPVLLQKNETDAQFEQLSSLLLDNHNFIKAAFGSHNIRSLAHAIAYAQKIGLTKKDYEIQMLYGMGEALGKVLLSRGHQVRMYMPLGEMLSGMSYLVRRLLENTSQTGFLKLSQFDHMDPDVLLAKPTEVIAKKASTPGGFINASHTDFSEKDSRAAFLHALELTKKSLPLVAPLILNGEKTIAGKTGTGVCPSQKDLLVCEYQQASIQQAEIAIKNSVSSADELDHLGFIHRAEQLLRLADLLSADRFKLAALMCLEVGKTWIEADADVAEAIDFCRYYALQAQTELAPLKMGDIAGEHNVLSYQPRGPAVIIAPWNFPLAILTGMSVAAYVCGNPIIIKPSELSCAIAFSLYQYMMKAGFLKTAVQFLPGVGEEIGPYLSSHKDIAIIAFTGSRSVGQSIQKLAHAESEGQTQIKQVITELGGKNAIIIDDDADMDEAVYGSCLSAFSYAGQKCSAASRIILVGSAKQDFQRRFTEAAKSIVIGASHDPATYMGPVIDEESYLRLKNTLQRLKADTTLELLYESMVPSHGYFIPITIFLVKDPKHWLMQTELFGPIVALYHAKDITDAVGVANNTSYGLTGALFSRSPKNITYVRENFLAGNLYINQKCTGALVHRQPFGGFKMSGSGTKAGGPHYLLQFVHSKLVSENTMRRGFTEDLS